jgi:hypothetical protein
MSATVVKLENFAAHIAHASKRLWRNGPILVRVPVVSPTAVGQIWLDRVWLGKHRVAILAL